MKKLTFFTLLFLGGQLLFGQTNDTSKSIDSLQVERNNKANRLNEVGIQIKALTAEKEKLAYDILVLDDQIIPWPRWTSGFSGTLGFNSVNTDNWFFREDPSISSTAISFASTGFVMLEHLKWYWKTDYRGSLGWLKFDNKDSDEDNPAFRTTSDMLQAKSIFGYRLNKKLFFATGAYYRTAMLDNKFNNPGYVTLALAGLTWKPTPNLMVDVVPLTYNWILSKEEDAFVSSLGTQLHITNSLPITKGLIWKTDLMVFASYKDFNTLSNWTWYNMLTTSVKGLGLVFDIGLRDNPQEALAFGADKNTIQTWWMFGVNYAFSLPKK